MMWLDYKKPAEIMKTGPITVNQILKSLEIAGPEDASIILQFSIQQISSHIKYKQQKMSSFVPNF